MEQEQRPEDAWADYRRALAHQTIVWQKSGGAATHLPCLNERYGKVIHPLRQLGQREEAARLELEWKGVTERGKLSPPPP